MIPLLALKALPWRFIGIAAIAVAVLTLGWRASVWHESHKTLQIVQAQLDSERACEADSACAKRAATLALEAAQDAAQKAAGAVQGALEREEQAQREASEWRKRYRAAVNEDPSCAEWNSAPVRCPL